LASTSTVSASWVDDDERTRCADRALDRTPARPRQPLSLLTTLSLPCQTHPHLSTLAMAA
jgi:hypothetical protein